MKLPPKAVARSLIAAITIFMTPVEAATRLIIDTLDRGIAGKAQIVISEDRIRVTHSSLPRQEMLFFAKDRQVLFVHHARKEVTRVDPQMLQQSVDQLAGLAEQLKEQRARLPEDKREQFDAMLESLGIMNPDQIGAAQLTLKALGKTDTVSGIRCEWWQVSRDDEVIGQSCLSKNENLKIDAADFGVLIRMAGYMQELQIGRAHV